MLFGEELLLGLNSCVSDHPFLSLSLSLSLSLFLSDYYGDGDEDVMSVGGEGAARDASFQQDPEFYEFSCLSTEETWNYLDSQVREVSKELKVWRWGIPPLGGPTVKELCDIFSLGSLSLLLPLSPSLPLPLPLRVLFVG